MRGCMLCASRVTDKTGYTRLPVALQKRDTSATKKQDYSSTVVWF
ncbi:hypothetical protein PROFUN_09897 [Planoprotostelium fungivorum]|uniref:Uncharacterized protein n=1 Tax=Planoprotostelium fungivorum TaxID=1890364 RepID=A0A2P6NGI2_9EUKA|nr:hypothetical protein PROFUN_09897 [Planoprotostelium fungivorum]